MSVHATLTVYTYQGAYYTAYGPVLPGAHVVFRNQLTKQVFDGITDLYGLLYLDLPDGMYDWKVEAAERITQFGTGVSLSASASNTYTGAWYLMEYFDFKTLNLIETGPGRVNLIPGMSRIRTNDSVGLLATPDPDCLLDHWVIDGHVDGAQVSVTFVMDMDHTYEAVFRKKTVEPPTTVSTLVDTYNGIGIYVTPDGSRFTFTYKALTYGPYPSTDLATAAIDQILGTPPSGTVPIPAGYTLTEIYKGVPVYRSNQTGAYKIQLYGQAWEDIVLLTMIHDIIDAWYATNPSAPTPPPLGISSDTTYLGGLEMKKGDAGTMGADASRSQRCRAC